MIPLMKNAFSNEIETKKLLADFIIKADRLSMSDECFLFEKEFSKLQDTKNSILFNSGASANLCILQSLKNLNLLRNGSKIGFSAVTWATNVMPIFQLNMIPIPIDCNPKTLNVMSDNLLDRLKVECLDALFITNALGFAGDLENIKEICEEKEIILIEDNCESLGTVLSGKKTGNFSLMSSFSFYVAHHMSTIEGGMVCTMNNDMADMLRMVRANGWDRNLNSKKKELLRKESNIKTEFIANYSFYDLSYNMRPTEITGFLGRLQLKMLDFNIKKREENFENLNEVTKSNQDLIQLDRSHITVLSNFAFPVICKSIELKEKYIRKFKENNVEIRPIISGNMQKQPFYKKYSKKHFDLPGSNFIHDCGFYCGNYPELSNSDLETIKKCLSYE